MRANGVSGVSYIQSEKYIGKRAGRGRECVERGARGGIVTGFSDEKRAKALSVYGA